MTHKTNPWERAATIIGVTATLLFSIGAIALFVMAIISAINEYGWELLWVPVTFGVFIGAAYLILLLASYIADKWRKASRKWEEKHNPEGREPEWR